MTEIRFYHLQRSGIDRVLPEILGKALERGHRVVVRTSDEAETERLNEHLWSFHPDSFLPHGSRKDGNAEGQPVWLTAAGENPNGADTLILTGGAESFGLENFRLCCEMLDGNDPQAVAAARTRWKTYRDAGHTVTYWQQTEQGGWENKA